MKKFLHTMLALVFIFGISSNASANEGLDLDSLIGGLAWEETTTETKTTEPSNEELNNLFNNSEKGNTETKTEEITIETETDLDSINNTVETIETETTDNNVEPIVEDNNTNENVVATDGIEYNYEPTVDGLENVSTPTYVDTTYVSGGKGWNKLTATWLNEILVIMLSLGLFGWVLAYNKRKKA